MFTFTITADTTEDFKKAVKQIHDICEGNRAEQFKAGDNVYLCDLCRSKHELERNWLTAEWKVGGIDPYVGMLLTVSWVSPITPRGDAWLHFKELFYSHPSDKFKHAKPQTNG